MKNKFLLHILLFCGLLPKGVLAQDERITDLQYNFVIKSKIQSQAKEVASMRTASATPDTLFLPFFEDFSTNSVWPLQDRWTDSSTFVNYNFGINPPSVGMVTFDGLNQQGNPYDNSNANASGLCDALTSKPLNLFNDDNGLPEEIIRR
jgi:hypothetical protein